jgi:hypothetical protein
MARRPTTDRAQRGNPRAGKAAREPELVGTLLATTHKAMARRAGLAVDRVTWTEVVGERVAARTLPRSLRDGVLTIIVESPVWAQELSLLSTEILRRLAERGIRAGAIRFRTGPIESAPAASRPKAPPVPPPAPLPPDVEERLAQIEDPELRAVIASAVGHSLANAERLKQKPSARAPRSAGARSGRPAQNDPPPPAKSKRNRE